MSDFIILNEKKYTSGNIVKSSAHIYAHIMKFVANKNRSGKWVSTIHEQSGQLSEITNASTWREVTENPTKLEEIRRDAIAEYVKDGNRNADSIFAIVHNDFPDITVFKNWDILKQYLINIANKDNDFNTAEYIANNY